MIMPRLVISVCMLIVLMACSREQGSAVAAAPAFGSAYDGAALQDISRILNEYCESGNVGVFCPGPSEMDAVVRAFIEANPSASLARPGAVVLCLRFRLGCGVELELDPPRFWFGCTSLILVNSGLQ